MKEMALVISCSFHALAFPEPVKMESDGRTLNFGFSHNAETGEWTLTFSPNAERQEEDSKPGARALTVCAACDDMIGEPLRILLPRLEALELIASKQDGDYVEPEIEIEEDGEDEEENSGESDDPIADELGMDEEDKAAAREHIAETAVKLPQGSDASDGWEDPDPSDIAAYGPKQEAVAEPEPVKEPEKPKSVADLFAPAPVAKPVRTPRAGAATVNNKGGKRPSRASAKVIANGGATTGDVRDWANAHGMEVSERGQVSKEVIAAYNVAH